MELSQIGIFENLNDKPITQACCIYQMNLFPNTPLKSLPRRVQKTTNTNVLKTEVDAIIRSGFAGLSQEDQHLHDFKNMRDRCSNHTLLEYVRSIYKEYNLADPVCQTRPSEEWPTDPITPHKSTRKTFINILSSRSTHYSTSIKKETPSVKIAEEIGEQCSFDDFSESVFSQSNLLINEGLISQKTLVAAGSQYFPRSISGFRLGSVSELDIDEGRPNKYTASSFSLPIVIENELKIIGEDRVQNKGEQMPVKQESTISSTQYEPHQPAEDCPIKSHVKKINFISFKKPKQPVLLLEQNFRYCIGCESALLNINIQSHESVCEQFQQIFKLPPFEIVKLLKTKIVKLEQQVLLCTQSLQTKDATEMNEHSMKIVKHMQQIAEQGRITPSYNEEYLQMLGIGRRWCLLTEQLNKINWFIKIRQRLKEQFDL